MKFTIAATLLTMMASSVAATNSLRMSKQKFQAFRKAMESDRFDDEGSKAKIMKKMFAKAKPVDGGRKLEDAQAEADWDGFGFDVSEYSVKYAGCSAVQTYSQDLAEDENSDTVLAARRFVFFRLCPTQTCNKYSVGGCTENYGEYVLELEDYLAAVSEYYEEKNQKFCEYCAECFNGQNNGDDADDADGGNRRLEDADAADDADNADDAADDADDADAADDADNADAADNADDAADDADNAEDQAESVCDEDICQGSYDVCEDTDDDGLDAKEFMQCAAVQLDDDEEYYIAPHCSSDGYTVTLGVYSDEDCDIFVKSMKVSDVLGFYLDTSVFKSYFPRDCISCLEDDNDDDADENQITELCENLYQGSAKCNVKISGYSANSYQGDNQAQQEQVVCNFINNLQQGAYSESGEIILDNDWYFNVSNWRNSDEYMKEYKNAQFYFQRHVLQWQIAALVLSIVACLVMCVWVCCLRSALGKKNIPWRPRRSKDTPSGDLSRQNSGIVLGRSRSGPGTTPLI